VKESDIMSAPAELVNAEKTKITVEELWKDTKDDTILFIGDSLVRGVGCTFRLNTCHVGSDTLSGARIEHKED